MRMNGLGSKHWQAVGCCCVHSAKRTVSGREALSPMVTESSSSRSLASGNAKFISTRSCTIERLCHQISVADWHSRFTATLSNRGQPRGCISGVSPSSNIVAKNRKKQLQDDSGLRPALSHSVLELAVSCAQGLSEKVRDCIPREPR